jgi:hypothetical protein
MHSIIYLVGLVVVVFAVLRFFGIPERARPLGARAAIRRAF